jgi:hypothetical protein
MYPSSDFWLERTPSGNPVHSGKMKTNEKRRFNLIQCISLPQAVQFSSVNIFKIEISIYNITQTQNIGCFCTINRHERTVAAAVEIYIFYQV